MGANTLTGTNTTDYSKTRQSDCPHGALSAREIQVVDGVARGWTNKKIANGMGITEGTVKVHVWAILRKLHLTNRIQIALWHHKIKVAA